MKRFVMKAFRFTSSGLLGNKAFGFCQVLLCKQRGPSGYSGKPEETEFCAGLLVASTLLQRFSILRTIIPCH